MKKFSKKVGMNGDAKEEKDEDAEEKKAGGDEVDGEHERGRLPVRRRRRGRGRGGGRRRLVF